MVAGLKVVSYSQRNVIVLCSWARHLTLTVPLSIQVYKWVPANLMLGSDSAMANVHVPSFILQKLGIISGLMGHLANMHT